MELKLAILLVLTEATESFNRTFMELKRKSRVRGCNETDSFNRTFMELKLITETF